MQTTGTSTGSGQNAGGDRPGFAVTQRLVLWENIWLPVVVALWISAFGFGLAHFPWNGLWDGFSNVAEAGQATKKLAALSWELFFLAFVLLLNRHWFSRRTCRYRAVFDSKRRVNFSDPELLNSLSAQDFLGARVLPYTESALYTIDTASGPLTISGTFANVAALADRRFAGDSIRDALAQTDFPRQLRATSELLAAVWFRRFATAYILLNILVPFTIASVTGDSGPFPGLDAVSASAAFLLACVYPFFILGSNVALTPDSLELRTSFRAMTVPLDAVRQIAPGSGGFTLMYAKDGVTRRAHIAQCMFAASILPLYFTLCGHVSGPCADDGNGVAADVAGPSAGR